MNKKHLLILLIILILTVTSVSLVACNVNNGDNKNEEGLTTTLDPNVPIGTSITVRYKSSHDIYGYVEGESTQTIQYGKSKTSTVTAVANLGYKFVSWSDGVTEATRSNESPSKSGDIVAVIGKGHERYTYDKNGIHYFDEREIIKKALKKRKDAK